MDLPETQQDLLEEGMIIGMKGLSPEVRRILLEERRKIMDQIEFTDINANISHKNFD